jgi:hypothetical protein
LDFRYRRCFLGVTCTFCQSFRDEFAGKCAG